MFEMVHHIETCSSIISINNINFTYTVKEGTNMRPSLEANFKYVHELTATLNTIQYTCRWHSGDKSEMKKAHDNAYAICEYLGVKVEV